MLNKTSHFFIIHSNGTGPSMLILVTFPIPFVQTLTRDVS